MKQIFIIFITITFALLSSRGNEHKSTISQNTESIADRLIELINE